MMNSERFAVDEEYRAEQFQSAPEDRPLVAHFSGNNPNVMLKAARLIENQCDAIGAIDFILSINSVVLRLYIPH
jgi:tRNA-dihydrouridine synthase 1